MEVSLVRREHNYVHCCKIEAALLLSLSIPVTANIGGGSLSPPNCSPRETEKRSLQSSCLQLAANLCFVCSCKRWVSIEATKVAAAALEL